MGSGVEESLDEIQQKISHVGEIAGQCIYVWVDPLDINLKEKVVERLRLRERGGVWEFGAGDEEDEIPKIEKFFAQKEQKTNHFWGTTEEDEGKRGGREGRSGNYCRC